MALIFGLVLGVLAALGYQHWSELRKTKEAEHRLQEMTEAISRASASTPLPLARIRRRLEIEGTHPLKLETKELHAWGIQKEHVQDVAAVTGPAKLDELSEGVTDCLAMCFCQSKTRGVEINDLLKTGELASGKNLYFVLSEAELGRPTITALVS